jgi:hypothetical protein
MRNDEISLLILSKKDALKKDDYKIIKCFEAQLTGEPWPYDYEKLIKERNVIREEINNLEERKRLLDESGKEFE